MRRYRDRPRGFTTSSIVIPGGLQTVSLRTALGVVISGFFTSAAASTEASEETVVVKPSGQKSQIVVFEDPNFGVSFRIEFPSEGTLDQYVEVEALDYLEWFCGSIVGDPTPGWQCSVEDTFREVMMARYVEDLES